MLSTEQEGSKVRKALESETPHRLPAQYRDQNLAEDRALLGLIVFERRASSRLNLLAQ